MGSIPPAPIRKPPEMNFCSPLLRCVVLTALVAVIGQSLSAAIPLSNETHFSVVPTVTAAPSVRFDWVAQPAGTVVKFYRRALAATNTAGGSGGLASFSLRGTVTAPTNTFADTGLASGAQYEYYIERTDPSFAWAPYALRVVVTTGSPLEDQRGAVLLVVDDTVAGPLAEELKQYEMDLVGDGWSVVRMDSPRHNATDLGRATTLRTAIRNAATGNSAIKSVILFGKLPMVRSGWYSPDGHEDRAFETDAYYADYNGTWTDTVNNIASGTDDEHTNVAGDGKFDQDYYLPSAPELAVGRVDFSNMGSFRKFEIEYLRDYINKAHAWRQGHRAAPARVLQNDVSDIYMFGDTNFFRSAFSPTAVDNATLQPAASTSTYLWAFGYNLANSSMQGLPVQAIFTGDFKSYLMHWARPDASMRCFMTQPDWGLTSAWQSWYWHHLQAGRPIGDAVRYSLTSAWNSESSVESTSGWWSGIYGQSAVWSNFMGDPTLRMHVVAPPTSATVTKSGAVATLAWTHSAAPALLGYHVYRSSNRLTGYTRLTTTPVAGPGYVDNAAPAGDIYYQVRAVATTTTPSGSYINQSQAAWALWKSGGTANSIPVALPGNVVAKSDAPTRFTFSGTDADGTTPTPIVLRNPAHGQLRWDRGESFYVSAPGYIGTDSFEFIMSDGIAVSAPATVTVTVNATGDALLAWELPDVSTNTTPGQASTFAATYIQPGALTIGSGVTASSPAPKIDQFAIKGCDSAALDLNDYIAWTVTPDPTYTLSLSRATFGVFTDVESAVANVELRASTNNFATSYVTVPLHRGTITGGRGILTADLSDPALQGVTGPIQFRLYVWNNSGVTAATSVGIGLLKDDAGSGVADEIADLVVQGTVICSNSQAEVTRESTVIADGGADTSLEFVPGVPRVLTYTFANLGASPLTLGTPTITQEPANGTAIITRNPAATVPAGGAPTTFEVTVTPAVKAAVSFTVSITTNDPSRTPYDWTVSGAATALPAVAIPVPDQSVVPGRVFSYTVPAGTFTDADGDTLTYTVTKGDGSALPAWLTFDAGTRTFSGTPGVSDGGALTVRLIANDGFGGVTAEEFVVMVEAVDYIVSTTADTGAGSLRQAITDANAAAAAADTAAGRRIIFAVPGNAGTITLGSDFPTLTKSMTIDGGGASITIDGGVNKAYRPFNCATSTVNLTLKDLTLNRCGKTETAAIAMGGAIRWYRAGILTLERVTIQNGLAKSAAETSTAYAANGGGIHVEANVSEVVLNLTDVAIQNCTAQVVKGSSVGGLVYGGGLSVKGGVRVNMVRCRVLNNSLVTDATVTTTGYGGGISFNAPSLPLTLLDCTVSGNTGAQYGGGISYYLGSGAADDDARLTLNRCTIDANAAAPSAASGANKAAGGGIYATSATGKFGNVVLYASTVAGNTVSHGASTAYGGGIYTTASGTMTTSLYNSTVSANTATATTASNGVGGGIYHTSVASNRLALASSIIQGNTMSATGSATLGADITKGTNATMWGTPSYNLIGSTNGAHGMMQGVNGCIIGVASLTALADNGGLTRTMALQAGSVAIDAGSVGVPSTFEFDTTIDQRGAGYLRDGAPDIGAFEVQTVPPAITSQPAGATIGYNSTASLSVTATGADLSYQWYSGASGSVISPISGATSASYATPALTASSSYWVRVTGTNGSVDSSTATVTVLDAYTTWAGAISDPAKRGASADADGDGIMNLMEFALGLSQGSQDYEGSLSTDLFAGSGENYLALTYTRPEPAPNGVSYAVKVSADLVTWSAVQTAEVSSTADGGLRTITVRDTQAIGSGAPRRFIRLEVALP